MEEALKLEKRIIAVQDITPPQDYESLGEAAIQYGSFEDLPDKYKTMLVSLEEQLND